MQERRAEETRNNVIKKLHIVPIKIINIIHFQPQEETRFTELTNREEMLSFQSTYILYKFRKISEILKAIPPY